MVPVHEVGLATALPGRLGRALASATKQVQTALSGLARTDRILAGLGGSAGANDFLAARKQREPILARHPRMPTKLSRGTAPGHVGDDQDIELRQLWQPAVNRNRASSAESKHAAASAHLMLRVMDGRVAPALARPQVMSVVTVDRASGFGARPARQQSAGANVMSDVATATTRRAAGPRQSTAPAGERKIIPPMVAEAVAVTAATPAGAVAPLKLMIGRHRPGAAGASAENARRGAPSDSGAVQFGSLPMPQEIRLDRKYGSPVPASPIATAAAFAPVRRAVTSTAPGASRASMSIQAPELQSGNLSGFAAREDPATGAAQNAAAAASSNDAASPAGGGPTQGDVFLDGNLVGRWMARKLAHEAGRPPSGSSAFDPTRSPFPPGRMIGG